MEGIQEEMKAAPTPAPKEKYRDDDDEDDPMESFLWAKKDVGLTLASEALHAGYNSDEEVYAAAKAVDTGMIEYDSDAYPIVADKRKIEPIPALDHSSIDYEPFNKDFYEENASLSGLSEQDVVEYQKSLAIRVSGFDVPRPIKAFEESGFSQQLMNAIAKQGTGDSGQNVMQEKEVGRRENQGEALVVVCGVWILVWELDIIQSPIVFHPPLFLVDLWLLSVNTIRTGVMAQFKSYFVAASSTSSNQGLNNSSSLYANKRPALHGFVSGGTIGGDANVTRTTSSFTPAPVSGGNSTVQNSRENLNQNYSQSLRDRPRERRKPSGWDR